MHLTPSLQKNRPVQVCTFSGSLTPLAARVNKLVLRHKSSLARDRQASRDYAPCCTRPSVVCQAAQASASASLPGPRRQQRHAMMNDYFVTIPFGIAVTLSGLVSLALRGGWTGVAVALTGGMLFTMGSMSHDRTTAGQQSKSPLTLAAAGLAAALSRVSYDRAIVGVFGTMAATIVSAAVSLFLVYNVVLGGNKPQKGSSASPLSAKSNTASISTTAPKHETPAETPWWDSDSSDTASQRDQNELSDIEPAQAQRFQSVQAAGLSLTSYPGNVQAVATVTGIVLYARGIWGLWGETLGNSPASMAGALTSGLMLIGLAQTLLLKQASFQKQQGEE